MNTGRIPHRKEIRRHKKKQRKRKTLAICRIEKQREEWYTVPHSGILFYGNIQ
jgi:hypothetical protein